MVTTGEPVRALSHTHTECFDKPPTAMFSVGTQYVEKRKHGTRECTVIDILYTFHADGTFSHYRYVVRYEYLGQTMIDKDVVDVTIQKAMWPSSHGKDGHLKSMMVIESEK